MDTSKKNMSTTENDLTIDTDATIENNSKTNAKNLWKEVDLDTYEVKLLLL